MNTIFIICGHGNYGTGLQSSIELLLGQNTDLNYIDFMSEDSDITLKEKILKVINDNLNSQILFICDILGGTPYKVSAEIANYNENMEVVAGCNIGSIIEACFQKNDLLITDLAEHIVDLSKNSTARFEKIKNHNVIKEIVDEGI